MESQICWTWPCLHRLYKRRLKIVVYTIYSHLYIEQTPHTNRRVQIREWNCVLFSTYFLLSAVYSKTLKTNKHTYPVISWQTMVVNNSRFRYQCSDALYNRKWIFLCNLTVCWYLKAKYVYTVHVLECRSASRWWWIKTDSGLESRWVVWTTGKICCRMGGGSKYCWRWVQKMSI